MTDEILPFVEVLYGSAARGDDDTLSDVDVLIVEDRHIHRPSIQGATVVRYTWKEFCDMSEYGSLFLRHLRAEGRLIRCDGAGKKNYRRLLERLPPYPRALFDLRSFESAINDSELALTAGDTSVEFELASLATVMRHCSILASYLMGEEDFSRTGAVDLCCDRFGLGDNPKQQFRWLYTYRIAIARELPFIASASLGDGLRAVRTARAILNGVKEYASSPAVS
jgi:Nucleotidyltransferase domain